MLLISDARRLSLTLRRFSLLRHYAMIRADADYCRRRVIDATRPAA